MKEIEKLILLELKKQLNESTDGGTDEQSPYETENPQWVQDEEEEQAGDSQQTNPSDDESQGNQDPQDQNDQQQSNENQESEALKLYQHRSQKHLDSINNYIIGYNRFLTKIEKRRTHINQNSSSQENEQSIQEDNGDNTQQDPDNQQNKDPIAEAKRILGNVAISVKNMKNFIDDFISNFDPDTADEPFKSYTLDKHMKSDKYTIRWVNSYKKRAPNAKMDTLQELAALAPLMNLPELADVIENSSKLTDKAKNAVAKIVNVFRNKMHDIKSYEKMDRYLGTAPVKVEGGLYVVARYILKALENYFYENFDEFQSGKKRKVQAARESALSKELNNAFNNKYAKEIFKEWYEEISNFVQANDLRTIFEKWREVDSSLTQQHNIGYQRAQTEDEEEKFEKRQRILNKLDEIIKAAEKSDNKTQKVLLKFIKEKIKDLNLTESKNRQIENKLELLILEEIKRIKNG